MYSASLQINVFQSDPVRVTSSCRPLKRSIRNPFILNPRVCSVASMFNGTRIMSLAVSPPRLNKEPMATSMATAFKPFKQYLEYLAQGKLDGYLDSNSRNDKVPVSGVRLSRDPNLLLHGLGKNIDKKRTE